MRTVCIKGSNSGTSGADIGIGPKTDTVVGHNEQIFCLNEAQGVLWLLSSHWVPQHRFPAAHAMGGRERLRHVCQPNGWQSWDEWAEKRCKCCSMWIRPSSGAHTSSYWTDGCLIHWSMTGCTVWLMKHSSPWSPKLQSKGRRRSFWSLDWEREGTFNIKL